MARKVLNVAKDRWVLREKFPDGYLLDSDFSDWQKQLLYNRGIESKEEAALFLNPQYGHLHDPFLMDGMKEAVDRIEQAIIRKERITCYGDFDAMG
jgi:single-stranded-DNA-specific exonuclease